jgi:lamin B
LDKKEKDLGIAEKSLSMYESQVSDLSAKCSQAVADHKKVSDDFKDLEKECKKLRGQVEELRTSLKYESLARIESENNLQSLQEKMSFREQVYNQELTQIRTRQVECNKINGSPIQENETKLKESIQDLRDQYEAQMRAHKEEIQLLYENKVCKFLVWYIFLDLL